MPGQHRAASTPTHLPFLTGIRGLAASFVALRHFRGDLGILESTEVLSVYAFFVLSAYLLTLRSLETLPRERGERMGFWRGYAIKRVFRVYPLYLVATLVVFGATLAHPAVSDFLQREHGGFSLLGQASLVRPLRTLFWTIPLEMEFYLVIPFIVVLAASAPWSAVGACLGTSVVWSLIRDPAATLYDPHLLSGALLPVFLLGSACGIVVYEIRSAPDAGGATRWASRLFTGLAGRPGTYATLFVAMVLLTPEARSLFPVLGFLGDRSYRTMPVLIPTAFLCAAIVASTLSARPSDPLVRFFSTRAMERAGEISYSIYLTHPIAIGVVWGLEAALGDLPAVVALLLFGAVLYGVSSLTFALVERPTLKWGKRLARPVPEASPA